MSLTPKTIGQLNGIDQITATTLFLAEKNGVTVSVPYSEIAAVNYTEATYDDLVGGIAGNSLIPGKFYLITDFQTCYDQPDFEWNQNVIYGEDTYKTGSTEPLLVLATSVDGISTTAYTPEYPGDRIKYDISWDTTEVTNSPAKGRITERIDERNNRADYDFRAVEFKRYEGMMADGYYAGTVSVSNPFPALDPVTNEQLTGPEGFRQYATVTGTQFDWTNQFGPGDYLAVFNTLQIGCHNFYEVVSIDTNTSMTVTARFFYNESGNAYSHGSTHGLVSPYKPNIPSLMDESAEFYTFDDSGNTNNYLGDNVEWDTFILSNNVFMDGTYHNNRFGENMINNTFDDDMDNNTAGSYFQNNIITNDWDKNTVGNNFEWNFIRTDADGNVIGDYFQHNSIPNNEDFDRNKIGRYFSNNFIIINDDDFSENVIGDDFSNNTIVYDFKDNVILGNFSSNVIENSFQRNRIGFFFHSNTIESDFENNSVGNGFTNNTIYEMLYNTIGHDFRSNIIGNNFTYNQIGHDFHDNAIASDFGFGYSQARGNVIGNKFNHNSIGEYFYSNHIADGFAYNQVGEYFQNNRVDREHLSNTDFTAKVGGVTLLDFNLNYTVPTGLIDGTYSVPVTNTNPGQGLEVQITVVAGTVDTVQIISLGSGYFVEDLIIASVVDLNATAPSANASGELALRVVSITDTPLVYNEANCTIARNIQGQSLLTVLDGNGFYTTTDIVGPYVD